ncbi:MAG: class I SAM-dependent methyltransferase [Candidatus Sabulitectum sp.]|nr:class I SAM-dependent methyltransferase [Candidatus Sabulitectum sp.]
MKHDFLPSYHEAAEQCSILGADLSLESYTGMGVFLDILSESAGKTNLVGPMEIERLWTRHVLESVAFIPFLNDQPIIDVGTGAGFPGMVLSFFGYNVTMIESRRKKCAFLETAARLCGVSCRVVNGRVEDEGPFPQGSLFTSRAVKGPSKMVELISPSVPGGFTLITRVSTKSENSSRTLFSEELPVPPLDRKGFILQYRHPVNQKLRQPER